MLNVILNVADHNDTCTKQLHKFIIPPARNPSTNKSTDVSRDTKKENKGGGHLKNIRSIGRGEGGGARWDGVREKKNIPHLTARNILGA